MTDQKEKRALIEYEAVKPFVYATALGLAIGAPAAFSGNFLAGFVMGSSFSLVWYWGRGNLTATGPKRKKPRRNPDNYKVNWGDGKMPRFEQVAPGYITRQSFWADLRGLARKPEPRIINQPAVSPNRPKTLDQFAFVSFDNAGNQVQLLSCDVRNFLRRAWLYRPRGKGLGARFWGHRNQRTWPDWYPGPFWYEATMLLVRETQKGLGRQLIVPLGYQQEGLRWGPRETYEHLIYWYTK